MKRKESKETIKCACNIGPTFSDDIRINDNCERVDSCYINNDGTHGYECHPQYKKSLFVNTAKPDERNYFSVLDYEVFGIDFENRENINKLCKYPDIIWEYIETKDISEESLKQFDDKEELLTDLDAIHCKDRTVRGKIVRYYLKNPSEFLPDTWIVTKQYDSYLKEWTGDYKWKLFYRASEHEYSSLRFHRFCNSVKGPTLIVVKSSEGWIFGGFTTQSWNGFGIYYGMI